MDELAELHRFNAWANASLLAGVRRLRTDQLTERREGMYGTVLGVLTHLAQVQFGYLRLLRSRPHERLPADLSLEQVAAVIDETGTGLIEVARSCSPEDRVTIPWFGRDFTAAQCLRQVLTHSMNHRADVNGWLPLFGLESTGQDYINLALAEG